jgi:hypothetical protein
MEQILNEIKVSFTDSDINEFLSNLGESGCSYTRHYNHSEDFFLKINESYTVPKFPIHHDVRVSRPTDQYLESLNSFVRGLAPLFPDVFNGNTYLFDPAETLRPCFFQLFKIGEKRYLYLIRLDLLFRPQDHEIVERGSNDVTSAYNTDRLYLECDLIPLDSVTVNEGKISAFKISQSVDQTWIGETGRGYFVQGIWLDRELTKFFSKLFLPQGKRSYPYYPFTCKYRAICHTVVDFPKDKRNARLPVLHKATEFLNPHMEEIQEALRANEFSENLESFRNLKKQVPPFWQNIWNGLKLEPYLNEQDNKEFRLEN